MDEEDPITFSQNDRPCISFAALESMRKRGHLCDLTIKVQNHFFSVHRVILAASIPYFENVFSTIPVEPDIVVEELDPQALESLIHFAYTNEIKITVKNVESVLVAAQFLQLNQVCSACVKYLSERLRVENVLRLRTFACGVDNVDLFESCNQFIKKNFEQFMKCADFLKLPHSCIKKIISNDDLNTSSEEIVFEALMKWVKASPDERRVVLPDLLCEVRMIYLPVQYVIDKVETEELIISSKPCRNLVSEIKSYHLLKERRLRFPNLKKRPRNQFNCDLYGICSCNTCGYSVHYFDLTKGVWSVLASFETKWEPIHAVVAVNDIMYMFLDTTIQTFHFKTREWNVLDAKHKNVYGAAIVCNTNCIYCFGSYDAGYKQKLRCFDTQLNEWLPEGTVNMARYYHAAASVGDVIYVTGGYCGNNLNIVEKYSISTDQWSSVAPMLGGRYRHECCSVNGRIYVCGGEGANLTALSTAEVYVPQTEKWNSISCAKISNGGLSLVAHCNKLYAFTKANFEVYDSENDEWKSSPSRLERFKRVVSGPKVIFKRN